MLVIINDKYGSLVGWKHDISTWSKWRLLNEVTDICILVKAFKKNNSPFSVSIKFKLDGTK